MNGWVRLDGWMLAGWIDGWMDERVSEIQKVFAYVDTEKPDYGTLSPC